MSVFLAGCGGSGNSEPPSTGAVFMTDSLDGHDHVWIAVTKVTFTNDTGGTVDAYSRDDAMTVDVKTLRDGSGGRFAFLGKVRSDMYTSVTVRVDKDLALFAAGSTAGEAHEFDVNNGTFAELTLDFGGAVEIGPNDPFVIDFDLSNWTDAGTTVTGSPFLTVGTTTGLDAMTRQENVWMYGTVRNLSGAAPNQRFQLDMGDTADVSVQTSSTTVIGGASSLQNGDDVRVSGKYSITQNAFIATSVFEEPENITPAFEGSVSSINVAAGTFVVDIDEAEHILPLFTTVNIETDASTVFYNSSGQLVTLPNFFTALTAGTRLMVRGDYNVQTNTMLATHIEFADDET